MNRAQRRREKWSTFNPHMTYADFAADVDENARNVMMVLLRQLAGRDAPFDDEQLWNSIRELIISGLLKVWLRRVENGDFEIMPEFLIPKDNDNARLQRGLQ